MNCRKCGKQYEDFDGVGVVYCPKDQGGCGHCDHVSCSGTGRTNAANAALNAASPIVLRCDFCAAVVA